MPKIGPQQQVCDAYQPLVQLSEDKFFKEGEASTPKYHEASTKGSMNNLGTSM